MLTPPIQEGYATVFKQCKINMPYFLWVYFIIWWNHYHLGAYIFLPTSTFDMFFFLWPVGGKGLMAKLKAHNSGFRTRNRLFLRWLENALDRSAGFRRYLNAHSLCCNHVVIWAILARSRELIAGIFKALFYFIFCLENKNPGVQLFRASFFRSMFLLIFITSSF